MERSVAEESRDARLAHDHLDETYGERIGLLRVGEDESSDHQRVQDHPAHCEGDNDPRGAIAGETARPAAQVNQRGEKARQHEEDRHAENVNEGKDQVNDEGRRRIVVGPCRAVIDHTVGDGAVQHEA